MLNIAEGSSKFSKKDRKNFMVIARGSAFESAEIFDYLFETAAIKEEEYFNNLKSLVEISQMLYSLIRKLENY